MTDTNHTPTRRTADVKDVAQVLGLSKNSVYAHMRAGHIPFVQLGARKLVRVDVLDAILQSGLPKLPPVKQRPAAQDAAAAILD